MRGGVEWTMDPIGVPGGNPRLHGGGGLNINHPPLVEHTTHWPKQRPAPMEDHNDSGINSPSESGSSPEHNPSNQGTTTASNYISTPVITRAGPSPIINAHVLPKTTPSSTATEEPKYNREGGANGAPSTSQEDPIRDLQATFEKNLPLPIMSPKTSDNSEDETEDEQNLRVPKMNSHGKVKTFKCKQCGYVAITKLDFWEHSKSHIKADKLLTCPRCPFVTEYKHHLEYHLRNHFGSKPFKCNQCSYSCVNKSMLNSHMKSHSNVYQYRCKDCSYVSKYCHSLKLHLRKYGHRPGVVLNPDGSPNPLPIIDVYGNRRGPKPKGGSQIPDIIQQRLSLIMASQAANIPPPYPYFGGVPNPLFLASLQRAASQECPASPDNRSTGSASPPGTSEYLPGVSANHFLTLPSTSSPPHSFFSFAANFVGNNESAEPSSPHASTKKAPNETGSSSSTASMDPATEDVLDLRKTDQPRNRRKSSPFKLEHLPMNESSDEEDEEHTTMFENVQTTIKEEPMEGSSSSSDNNNQPNNFNCPYCNISFGDVVLYTMHMGYHGFRDPFTCNMCGEQCKDKVNFFLHIARTPHS